MSVDSVKGKQTTKQDIDWKQLIMDSESLIYSHQEKIRFPRKSIKFFNKQEVRGIPFPSMNTKRHPDLS